MRLSETNAFKRAQTSELFALLKLFEAGLDREAYQEVAAHREDEDLNLRTDIFRLTHRLLLGEVIRFEETYCRAVCIVIWLFEVHTIAPEVGIQCTDEILASSSAERPAEGMRLIVCYGTSVDQAYIHPLEVAVDRTIESVVIL